MRIYAEHLKVRAKVHDLDTHRDVKGVLWVDEAEGTAETYRFDHKGDKVLTVGPDGAAAWQTVLLKGRFKLVLLDKPDDSRFAKLMGAAKCGRCGSNMTLRGDELCFACKRADMGKPVRLERVDPAEENKCDRCSRNATWMVVDEVSVTPERGTLAAVEGLIGGAYLFDRATMAGTRHYCDKHYVGPRLLDIKGEIVSTDEGGLRPN